MRPELTTPADPTTEDLVRKAVAWHADQAPPAHRILATLRTGAPGRARRRGAVVLVPVAVVAAAVTALVVPFALRPAAITGGSGNLPAATPVTTPPAMTAPARPVVMDYRANWLPSGFVQETRQVSLSGDASQTIIWLPPGVTSTQSKQSGTGMIELTESKAGPQAAQSFVSAPAAEKTTVNGHPAVITTQAGPEMTTLAWMPDPTTVLQLNMAGVTDATLRHMAASIGPDRHGTVDVPLTLGYRPAGTYTGFGQTMVTVAGTSQADVQATVTAGAVTDGSSVQGDLVVAELKAQPTVADPAAQPGAQPVTVLGRRGWYVPNIFAGQHDKGVAPAVQVQLGSRWLTVSSEVPAETMRELTKVADGLTINPNVSYPWIAKP
jgi:hypothetical protein